MSRGRTLERWLSTSDAALSWAERIARWIMLGVSGGVGSTFVGLVIGYLTGNPFTGLVIGVVVGMVILVALSLRAVKIAAHPSPSVPETAPSGTVSADKEEQLESTPGSASVSEAVIDLGNTAPLFVLAGLFKPEEDSERRPIFFPALIQKWALAPVVEDGRTLVARGTEFEDCDIYGPVVFVLAEGSFDDTFHKCDWEEEWRAFWPATKPGRYVGVIALENCKFRRCNFKGASFVIKSDEYRRLYRRYTGDDFDGRRHRS